MKKFKNNFFLFLLSKVKNMCIIKIKFQQQQQQQKDDDV